MYRKNVGSLRSTMLCYYKEIQRSHGLRDIEENVLSRLFFYREFYNIEKKNMKKNQTI